MSFAVRYPVKPGMTFISGMPEVTHYFYQSLIISKLNKKCDALFVAVCKHCLFVILDDRDDIVADWNAVAYAELIINRIPWHCLTLFDKLEDFECIACEFMLTDEFTRLEKSLEHAFLSRTGTDHICTDTVDRAIEEVKTIMNSFKGTGTYDF